MLELIFRGFFEWIYGLILECWEYFSSGLLDIMSLDFSYLESHMPIIPTIKQVMLGVGWALLLGNLVFQAVKSMMAGIGVEGEDPKLNSGDVFLIHVLDQTLAYEVDQISVVEPTDTSKLQIENGKDYVTLVTCTPFGVNTHRLLVRGHRTEVPEVKLLAADTEVSAPIASTWMQHYLIGLGISVGSLALLIGGYFIIRRRRKS